MAWTGGYEPLARSEQVGILVGARGLHVEVGVLLLVAAPASGPSADATSAGAQVGLFAAAGWALGDRRWHQGAEVAAV
jgi:hypothetical protein